MFSTFYLNNSEPLYLQIYTGIKNEICSGNIKKHQKLPSVRKFAADYKVSINTVNNAYQQLVSEGFIYNKPRCGMFASELDILQLKPIKPISAPISVPQKVRYDLSQSTIDESHFPKDLWRKLTARAIDNLDMQYNDWKGNFELRESLRQYLYHSRGVRADMDQIVIGSGTATLLNFIILALKPESIAFENPGYMGAGNIFKSHQISLHPVDIEPDGISIEGLYSKPTQMVYVTPSHQYPLGMIMPVAKRMELLEWASRTKSYIIEDDYDSEYRFKGRPIPSLHSLDTSERVIYISTFSKAFLPSLRMAYMVIPKPLLHQFSILSYWGNTSTDFTQHAMAFMLSENYWEQHLRKMRTAYKKKHDYCIVLLKETFPDSVSIVTEETGLRMMLEIQTLYTEQHFISSALDAGIKVIGTLQSWMTSVPKGHPVQLLIGYGKIKDTEMPDVFQCLYNAWKPYL